ncbi:MAG: FIG056164: rhomboid family serine protease, partial [uncultured Nocardioidaceae bacterium]
DRRSNHAAGRHHPALLSPSRARDLHLLPALRASHLPGLHATGVGRLPVPRVRSGRQHRPPRGPDIVRGPGHRGRRDSHHRPDRGQRGPVHPGAGVAGGSVRNTARAPRSRRGRPLALGQRNVSPLPDLSHRAEHAGVVDLRQLSRVRPRTLALRGDVPRCGARGFGGGLLAVAPRPGHVGRVRCRLRHVRRCADLAAPAATRHLPAAPAARPEPGADVLRTQHLVAGTPWRTGHRSGDRRRFRLRPAAAAGIGARGNAGGHHGGVGAGRGGPYRRVPGV